VLIDEVVFRSATCLCEVGRSPAVAPVFTSKDALAVLLSTESLLFAALNVALVLSAPSAFGSDSWVPRLLSAAAASVLTAVAAGAGSAWVDLFVVGQFPHGGFAKAAVLLIALGIVAQPVLAVVIAAVVWRRQ
jgi:hypothetical protein